jgi:hypothetical protein
LARESRLDPKEAERDEKRSWLNDCLEQLGDLVDSIEADIEKVSSGRGKAKNKDQVRRHGCMIIGSTTCVTVIYIFCRSRSSRIGSKRIDGTLHVLSR